jgi:hypothetical protein
MDNDTIKLTIHFNDSTLDAEDREIAAQQLYNQLRYMDEVEAVDRIAYDPPAHSKPISTTLVGLLTAEVSWKNFKHLMAFLSDRLSGKTIELEVEIEGRKLKVSASSREELEFAIKLYLVRE